MSESMTGWCKGGCGARVEADRLPDGTAESFGRRWVRLMQQEGHHRLDFTFHPDIPEPVVEGEPTP